MMKKLNISGFLKQVFLGTVRTKQPSSYFRNGFYKNLTLVTKDNVKIGAALFEPLKVTENTKFVIFLHGSGTNRDDISDIGNIKYQNCLILVPDYRDFGDSEGVFEKSKVNFDVLACFDYLRDNYGTTKINLIGFSFGTAISSEYIRYISEYNHIMPCTLTLIAPFSSFKSLLSEFKLTSVIKKCLPFIWNIVEKDFDYDTIRNLEGFSNPIYLFHGKYDPLIKPCHSEKIQKKYNCYLKIVKSDHIRILLNEEVWKEIGNILV